MCCCCSCKTTTVYFDRPNLQAPPSTIGATTTTNDNNGSSCSQLHTKHLAAQLSTAAFKLCYYFATNLPAGSGTVAKATKGCVTAHQCAHEFCVDFALLITGYFFSLSSASCTHSMLLCQSHTFGAVLMQPVAFAILRLRFAVI